MGSLSKSYNYIYFIENDYFLYVCHHAIIEYKTTYAKCICIELKQPQNNNYLKQKVELQKKVTANCSITYIVGFIPRKSPPCNFFLPASATTLSSIGKKRMTYIFSPRYLTVIRLHRYLFSVHFSLMRMLSPHRIFFY